MKLFNEKLTDTHGYLEGGTDAVDEESSLLAVDYKKSVTKNYISLNADQIDSRLGGNDFYVTRKYDGELNVIFYDNGLTALINRSGRIKSGLPCSDEAGSLLKNAGIKQAVIPAELYVSEESGRTRIFEVLNAIADKNLIGTLRLAPFDIITLDGEPFKASSYGDIHGKLTDIFGKSNMCVPVRSQRASSKTDVKELYSKWVDKEGAEGLVVRTESPLIFKVKPRYTLDLVIVGFSEGTGDMKGRVRSLLLAMINEDGKYQVVGRTGNGLSDELRREFLQRLTPMVISSNYIETDSDHVAFRMIRPEIVIEILINDIIFESVAGPVVNTVIEVKDGKYIRRGECMGVSFVYPIFTRIRDDKKATPEDIRFSQISDIAFLPPSREGLSENIPQSKLIHREVYTKESGGKFMVRKFLIWKTNKEHFSDYAAYVLHYTDFSSDRKEPLAREVRISNDKDQITAIMQEMIEANIKKGWKQI